MSFDGVRKIYVGEKPGLRKQYKEDIDGDGDLDLILNFRFGEEPDPPEGTLSGETFDKAAARLAGSG